MRYSISRAIPHNPKSQKHPYENLVNVGIWALFLLQVDQPTDYAYCVAGEDDMVGIYVDLPAEQFDYEVTG